MQDLIVPIATSFTKDNKVDKAKMKELGKELIERGINALFVNGTTGVGPTLSAEEKKQTLEASYDVTNKILFQVGGLNFDEVKSLVLFSKDFDIIGVVAYPPYYFPKFPEKWVIRYYKEILEISPHPVYVYNYPEATHFDVSAAVLKKISDSGVAGIKDTHSELSHTLQYKITFPSMKVYNGKESLVVPTLASGLDGTVAALGNYAPELLVKARDLVSKGRIKEALEVHALINDFSGLLSRYGTLAAIYPAIKEMLGVDAGYPRPPMFPLSEDEEKAFLNELRVLKSKMTEILNK